MSVPSVAALIDFLNAHLSSDSTVITEKQRRLLDADLKVISMSLGGSPSSNESSSSDSGHGEDEEKGDDGTYFQMIKRYKIQHKYFSDAIKNKAQYVKLFIGTLTDILRGSINAPFLAVVVIAKSLNLNNTQRIALGLPKI